MYNTEYILQLWSKEYNESLIQNIEYINEYNEYVTQDIEYSSKVINIKNTEYKILSWVH